tara:strand:+ start:1843 stop:2022 length:180 start_codon:yes stop_codon:yes gene_type:complete
MNDYDMASKIQCICDDLKHIEESLQQEEYVQIKKISICDLIKIKILNTFKEWKTSQKMM